MSILTGPEISSAIECGGIVIRPFSYSQLGPNSYDVRLSPELLVYSPSHHLDWKELPDDGIPVRIGDTGCLLLPGHLYLGCVEEWIESRDYVPKIDGRSSAGRLGMRVHATAGVGDIGYRGRFTLEIDVVVPVKIYPRILCAQVSFETVVGRVIPYCGKYQDANEIQPSRVWREANS